MANDFLGELAWRGLIHQQTDEAGLRHHLSGGMRAAYVGYDPTADSLTIGNLVTIMLLVHFQRAGHRPVVVAGGGTGLIGDPSGKTAEREIRTKEQVAANVASQMRIFGRLLDFSKERSNAATIANNLDWLAPWSYLDFLRDVGKHFSVNVMIQKDSVRERLHNRDQGISYTEFSYMLLQAYDFLHLHRAQGVSLQMGGSDQWGNIVAGADLIRRFAAGRSGPGAVIVEDAAPTAFGLTTPLVTKADGTKFGKTESGAVWLTADRTSPYAYYQFWLNTSDDDVERFLKVFTLQAREQIEATLVQHRAGPGARVAQRELARAATDLLHGQEAREHAEKAAAALFSGEIGGLPAELLNEVLSAAPSSEHDRSQLEGEGVSLLELASQTICKSKSEARQSLGEGAMSVNGKKAGPADRLTTKDLLHGTVIALRRGKKTWHVTRWQ